MRHPPPGKAGIWRAEEPPSALKGQKQKGTCLRGEAREGMAPQADLASHHSLAAS